MRVPFFIIKLIHTYFTFIEVFIYKQKHFEELKMYYYRNLVALNDDGDPGWEAITHMKQFIIDKIKTAEEQANETPSKSFIL